MEEELVSHSIKISEYSDKLVDLVFQYGPKLVLAIIVLFVGFRVISFINKMIDKGMAKSDIDQTLRPFLNAISNGLLKLMLLISVSAMVGIETTSFVAVLGAMGLAIGLSLQGTLSNFAGGIMILVLKPYKVGDFIEAQGYMGVVKKVGIIVTELTTVQNRLIFIPNGPLANGSLTNYSVNGEIRLDLLIGISYDADIREAKAILEKVLLADKRVLKDPAYVIAVGELGDSSINIHVRPWVKNADYWDLKWSLLEDIKYALDEANIGIPYPQTDVHFYDTSKK